MLTKISCMSEGSVYENKVKIFRGKSLNTTFVDNFCEIMFSEIQRRWFCFKSQLVKCQTSTFQTHNGRRSLWSYELLNDMPKRFFRACHK